MKTLNITFTDEEFKKLSKAKEVKTKTYPSWRKFILSLAKGTSVKRNGNGLKGGKAK